AFDRKWELKRESDGLLYVTVGENAWEFPAPIVQSGTRWRFDTQQGIEEMEDRRIGQYELDAIRTCDDYVKAQQKYFAMDPDGDSVKAYAQQLRSAPGRHDGLYWPDDDTGLESPIGPLVTHAVEAGELDDPSKAKARQPYRGYFFKVLTSQAAAANGGAKDYIDASGRMTGGFALIAWPADYGHTGIMSFI